MTLTTLQCTSVPLAEALLELLIVQNMGTGYMTFADVVENVGK
jgi:hypothetical protein